MYKVTIESDEGVTTRQADRLDQALTRVLDAHRPGPDVGDVLARVVASLMFGALPEHQRKFAEAARAAAEGPVKL